MPQLSGQGEPRATARAKDFFLILASRLCMPLSVDALRAGYASKAGEILGILRPLGRLHRSKQEHAKRRTDHGTGRNGNQQHREKRGRTAAHQFAVDCDNENCRQQKRREHSVQNSGPKEHPDGTDVREVDPDAYECGDNDDTKKRTRHLEFIVQATTPAENFCCSVSC